MGKKRKKITVGYHLLYAFAYLHALLPLRVLYLFSDTFYGIIYYLIGYRRKLVRQNLKNAFPTRSEQEIIRMEKKFYHHLCDYFFETIKLLHISDKEMGKRMHFENPEIINRLTQKGSSCLLTLGHYGNWEWVTSIGNYVERDREHGFIYKQLHSQAFDRLFYRIRSRFTPVPIEMNNAYRKMIELHRAGKTLAVGFITDQRPPGYLEYYWTTFLNQETLVQTGMEKIAAHLGYSVLYLDIVKIKRGYYSGTFSLITPNAGREPQFTVTERYMRKLEETVLNEPAYYLWSHNRWKFHKRPGKNDSERNDPERNDPERNDL